MMNRRLIVFALSCFSAATVGFFAGEWCARSAPSRDVARSAAASRAVAQPPSLSPAINDEWPKSEIAAARVNELVAEPPSPRRNDALRLALQTMAQTDAAGALRIAAAEPNRRLRAELIAAALRGWGDVAGGKAADWVFLQQDAGGRADRLLSVFEGAVSHPDTAAELAGKLAGQHPEEARDIGDALIYALGKAGAFSDAARFAGTGSPAVQAEWIAAAYANWGNYQPQAAASAALELQDPTLLTSAVDAVLGNWAAIDPKGLASFALSTLPAGAQRTRAISNALIHWSADDPVAAAEWISAVGGIPECDQGEAAIATHQDVLRRPDLAIRWAEMITDPTLRSQTLASVLQSWGNLDPLESRQFVESTADLLPNDRAAILAQLSR